MSVEYKHFIYTDSPGTKTVGESKKLIKELRDRGIIKVSDVTFIPSPIVPKGKDEGEDIERLKAKYMFGIMNPYGQQYCKNYNPLESFLGDSSIDGIEQYVILFHTESAPGDKGLVELFNISDFSYSVKEKGIYGDISICSSKFFLIQPLGEMDSEIRNPKGVNIANGLDPIQIEDDTDGIEIYFTDGFYSQKEALDGEYVLNGHNVISGEDVSKAIRPTHYGIAIELFKNNPKVDTLQTSDVFKTVLNNTIGVNQVADGGNWH